MQLVGGFCVRKILDEIIAIPTQEAAHRFSGLVSMNETGEFLFELLQTSQTKESLVKALMDNYEIDEQTAEADIATFVEILQENHLLEEPV